MALTCLRQRWRVDDFSVAVWELGHRRVHCDEPTIKDHQRDALATHASAS
jgi:hypothetical protein